MRTRGISAAVAAILLVAVGAALLGGNRPVQAARDLGVAIRYKAGWNLVGGPDGTVFGSSGSIYTFGDGSGSYQTSAGTDQTRGGKGYWAYFPADTTVMLNGAGVTGQQLSLPAGQYIMIGNPSGTQRVSVAGADQVLTYDPGTSTFTQTTTLSVGEGAWAFSANGGTLALAAAGTTLAIPTSAPPAQAANATGANGGSSPAPSTSGSSSGAISVAYQGPANNVPGLPAGYHGYVFLVSGFKTSDLTEQQLNDALNVSGPQGPLNEFAFGTSMSNPSALLIALPGGLPQGTYTLSIVLPDGRSAQASFPGGG